MALHESNKDFSQSENSIAVLEMIIYSDVKNDIKCLVLIKRKYLF